MDAFVNNLKAITEDETKKSDVKLKVLTQWIGANYKSENIDCKPFED